MKRIVYLGYLSTSGSLALPAQQIPPDAIFYNGKILTVDAGFTTQQAFAIRGAQYVAVGNNSTVRNLPARIRGSSY